MEKVRVGVLGCGNISNGRYLPQITEMPMAELVAVCDADPERTRRTRERFNVPESYISLDDMLEKSDFDLLVNLTAIQAHYETNLKAVKAGKHVYSEKPFAGNVEQATEIIDEAKKRNVKFAAGSDSWLNPTYQKARQLIRDGAIGHVCFAVCHSSHCGPANFPNNGTDPTWFYKKGAGPLYDMGVHGLHQITGLLGPAKAVTCMSGRATPQLVIQGGPAKGKVIDVEVDDTTLMILDFGNNTFAYLDAAYTVRNGLHFPRGPRLQVFGSDGTIMTNERGAAMPLAVFRADTEKGLIGWMDVDPGPSRDHGVLHLVNAILDPSREILISGEHARHVIEIMEKCYVAAHEGRTISLETTF